MKKEQIERIYIIILQLLLAYLGSVYIVNDNINIVTIFKTDFFLFLLLFIFFFFISSHFMFRIKDIYNFLYKKRYLVAFLLFLILVLGKFNGSSYGMWENYIEPNYKVNSFTPLIGDARAIRSDEWLVNSSYVLSQTTTGYNYFNPVMRGTATDVFATIPVPVKNILCIGKPFLLGYLFFGRDYGMSIYWYGRLIALFLVSFELLMIITRKNKKASLLGTMLITFSAPVFWWYSAQLVEMLISGGLCIILFYNFLKTDSLKKKVFYSLLLIPAFFSYVVTLYPAWLVPLSYFYLILAVYFFIAFKDKHKYKIKKLWPLFITIGGIILLFAYFFFLSKDTFKQLMSTVYPGARFIVGGKSFENFLTYSSSIYFPYFDVGNPCEYSTFYSMFPFSIIIGAYYIFKNRKNLKNEILIISIFSLIVIYLLFSFVSFPKILAKITLLYMTPVERLTVIISYLCVILMALLYGKIKLNTKKEKISFTIVAIVSSLFSCIIAKYMLPNNYLSINKVIVSFVILTLISILWVIKNKKTTVMLLVVVALVTVFSTVSVNPLMKGFSGVYKKPISKELKKYKTEDANWVSLDSFLIANYLGTQGLKVLNSTNLYPNINLWKKIDKEKKYNKVYNRYAHIDMELDNKNTKFELISSDHFKLKITPEDLCKLKVNYATSLKSLDEYNNSNVTFTSKYHKDNIYIYKVNCIGE